ncbi:parallel beta-helix repeat protein [Pseudomonas hunanensis]|uniref:Parallel beta-helix repeat protein n=1 Tax=Pseudomonas hunanensis TaxID=1247546 RepID=A0ACC6K8G7_9PSED|nr:right-handed parallel beta-helix repeat-containing protein [Pseudomonas hunanensis]MDR6714700.1 parallel beta-helix repeat protein [Pseudomonas hunanensis]
MSKGSFAILCTGLALVFSSAAAEKIDEKLCDLKSISGQNGKITLDGTCKYKGYIKIDKSNTRLDCNGATLIGNVGDKYGILVKGRGLNNITVSNCNLEGYDKAAVMIMSGLKSDELSRDYLKSYKLAPHDVLLQHLNIKGSRGNGVHFNGYVNNSTLQDSKISGSRGVAVYLGGSTQSITLEGNTFSSNGGVAEKKKREALAIDSSAKNIVKNNKFISNAAGGIFLYKNCGEHSDRPGATARWQSSNDNLITQNIFIGERVGIWVASRQSRDLSGWKCGDPSVGEGNKFYRDYANNNTITRNIFCRNKLSIKIEGDMNKLSGNKFDDVSKDVIQIPYLSKVKPDGSVSVGNVIGQPEQLDSEGRARCSM